jgi:hypothetical protein
VELVKQILRVSSILLGCWQKFIFENVAKNSAEAKGFSVYAGDALKAVQASLTGSGQAFVTWDITLVTPCTWINVACDSQNNVNYL